MSDVLRDLVSKATQANPEQDSCMHERYQAIERLRTLAPELALLVADMVDELREWFPERAVVARPNTVAALLVRVDRLTEGTK